MRNQISFVYGNPAVMPMVMGVTYSLGCVATQDITIGAMSLEFTVPDGILINNVVLSNGDDVAFHYVDEPTVPIPHERAGWFSTSNTPFELHAGEVFMTMEFELTKPLAVGTEVRFEMMDSPTVSFAGVMPEALPYYNQTIQMQLMVQGKTTIADRKEAQGYISKPLFSTCNKCQMYSGRKCTMGGFVVAKGGKCDYFMAKA